MKVTKGEEQVNTFEDKVQDSGNALQRRFCSVCATPLWNDGGDFGKSLAVFYSALDDFGKGQPESLGERENTYGSMVGMLRLSGRPDIG